MLKCIVNLWFKCIVTCNIWLKRIVNARLNKGILKRIVSARLNKGILKRIVSASFIVFLAYG